MFKNVLLLFSNNKLMADVMTQQLVQSLKGYFKKEEFSDKVLHIIEIDENFGNGKRKIATPVFGEQLLIFLFILLFCFVRGTF